MEWDFKLKRIDECRLLSIIFVLAKIIAIILREGGGDVYTMRDGVFNLVGQDCYC